MASLVKLLKEASDALAAIQNELRKKVYNPLSVQEENQIKEKLADPNTSSSEKRMLNDQLIKANMRFAFGMANKLRNAVVPMDDAFASAALGLAIAAQHFDPTKEYRFGTYAAHWIKAEVMKANYGSGDVHVPTHHQQAKYKADKELEKTGKDKTPSFYSMASPMAGSEEGEMLDPLDQIGSGEEDVERRDLRNHIDTIIARMPVNKESQRARAKDILYNLWDLVPNPMSVEELSAEYGVSANAIRNIQKYVMDQIKRAGRPSGF